MLSKLLLTGSIKNKKITVFILLSFILSLAFFLFSYGSQFLFCIIFPLSEELHFKILEGRSTDNKFSQFSSEKIFVFLSLLEDNFIGYRQNSRLLFFSHHFKSVTPLSSHLHGFWEVRYNSYFRSCVSKLFFSLCLLSRFFSLSLTFFPVEYVMPRCRFVGIYPFWYTLSFLGLFWCLT